MAMARVIAAVPVILLLIMALLATSGASRPLGSDAWVPAAREAVSDDGGVMQFLRQMYLQQLGAGPSCGTNSSNGGCPRRP
ncbi:hypothetical protein BDA96_10G124500 [Sorghum bicolor]|uniref:Uncharacterized protein n=2 Tax=Sorghum bicolor TaxID=4558 RepID=A0A921Q3T7_SORBI|nr:hypothetical protein BDA96_10G124500 [Sorghum bicolor]OQU76164.1 hypothetical protein SORBI_3010G102100 [Sorghum bicolor]